MNIRKCSSQKNNLFFKDDMSFCPAKFACTQYKNIGASCIYKTEIWDTSACFKHVLRTPLSYYHHFYYFILISFTTFSAVESSRLDSQQFIEVLGTHIRDVLHIGPTTFRKNCFRLLLFLGKRYRHGSANERE